MARWTEDPGTNLRTPTIHYLKWHPEAGIEEEDTCSISDLNAVAGLIEWFAKE